MSLRRLFAAALVAMSAVALAPQESHAQYGGCSTCGTVSTVQPMFVRYGLFGRPRAVWYGTPVTTVAPTAVFSPVSSGCSSCATSAFYPSACSFCSSCAPSGCSSCARTGCSTCSTSFRPSIVSVPVTTFRPVSSCNSCGGVATYMQPVTTFTQQVQYTPQTSCSSSCATSTCYAPSCGSSCSGCSQCSGSSSCGSSCTGCSQCSGQNHNHGNDQYPQTQPGVGYNPANSQPQVPQTIRNEHPQTYQDPQPQPTPNTYGNDQQESLRPIPNTSGASAPNNGGYNGQPQLIDPDSHTTQAPKRSWNFHQAVASQDDLTSRIIPVEHQKPAPRVQNDVPANDGWRAARSR